MVISFLVDLTNLLQLIRPFEKLYSAYSYTSVLFRNLEQIKLLTS